MHVFSLRSGSHDRGWSMIVPGTRSTGYVSAERLSTQKGPSLGVPTCLHETPRPVILLIERWYNNVFNLTGAHHVCLDR